MTSGGSRKEAGRKVKRLFTPFGRATLIACKSALTADNARGYDWPESTKLIMSRISPELWDRLKTVKTSVILTMVELAEAEVSNG